MEGQDRGASEKKTARNVGTRQTRQSQVACETSCSCLSITDLIGNKEFLEAIKKTVRKAIREELQELKQELNRVSKQVEVNESKIVALEIEKEHKDKQITDLVKRVESQEEAISRLRNKSMEAEQYSRRNCARFFGIPEIKGENTDKIVLEVAKEKLGINLRLDDIDRSHRVGAILRTGPASGASQPAPDSASSSQASKSTSTSTSWATVATEAKRKNARHRPIIVKFSTYRARQSVMAVRRLLKDTGISIAEDLTSSNYEILKEARLSTKVSAAWSQDGRILVALPTTNGKSIRKVISTVDEARKLR